MKILKMNKELTIDKFDKGVKDVLLSLELKYREVCKNNTEESISISVFTLQNIMAFSELRKKLFEEK